MNNSGNAKDDNIYATKSLQIVHKKMFKGSTLPPQIATLNQQNNNEYRGRTQTQLPKMRPIKDIEVRSVELELRAKEAEEYRYFTFPL